MASYCDHRLCDVTSPDVLLYRWLVFCLNSASVDGYWAHARVQPFLQINACVQHRHTEISRALHDAIPRTEVDCDLRGEGDTADASAEDWRLKSEYCERLHRLRVPDSNVRLCRTTVHVIPRCTISTRPNAGSSRVGVTEFRGVYRYDTIRDAILTCARKPT